MPGDPFGVDYLAPIATAKVCALALLVALAAFGRSILAVVAQWTVIGTLARLVVGIILDALWGTAHDIREGATLGGVLGGSLSLYVIWQIARSDR